MPSLCCSKSTPASSTAWGQARLQPLASTSHGIESSSTRSTVLPGDGHGRRRFAEGVAEVFAVTSPMFLSGRAWSRSGSKGCGSISPNGRASPTGMVRNCGRGRRSSAEQVRQGSGPAHRGHPRSGKPVWCSRCGGCCRGRGPVPKLQANLILTHLGSEMTSLSLEGTYEPPLGPLGRAADRVALRKFAEATVKDWVDRVAEVVAHVHEFS